jgi:hypothetical protein
MNVKPHLSWFCGETHWCCGTRKHRHRYWLAAFLCVIRKGKR